MERKQIDVKSYFYFEGVLPRGGLMDMTFPLSITWYSGICGAKFSKKTRLPRRSLRRGWIRGYSKIFAEHDDLHL